MFISPAYKATCLLFELTSGWTVSKELLVDKQQNVFRYRLESVTKDFSNFFDVSIVILHINNKQQKAD